MCLSTEPAVNPKVIEKLKEWGYQVYMSEGNTSYPWLVFTDGVRIGLYEEDRLAGPSLMARCYPSKHYGCGTTTFGDQSLNDRDFAFTKETVEQTLNYRFGHGARSWKNWKEYVEHERFFSYQQV